MPTDADTGLVRVSLRTVPQRFTLANGLTAILAPTDGGHAVHIAAFIGLGSAYETEDTSGISHFVEHLLFQGSDKFASSAELCAFVEERGGEVNAHTTPEFTSVYVTLHRDYAAEGIEILHALTFGVATDRWDVERERAIILHEHATEWDPEAMIRESLWPGHPLSYEVSGNDTTVGGFRRDDLAAHYHAHMQPRNMVVVIAGVFDSAEVEEVLRAKFEAVPAAKQPMPVVAQEPAPAENPVRVVRPADGGGCGVLIAMPVCGIGSPDVLPLVAANFLLGGGLSSRLFLRIRERDGLAYEVGTELTTFRHCGYFVVHAACTPQHLRECATRLLEELRLFAAEGVTDVEMSRLRRFVRCNVDFRMDNPMELAAWYGAYELLVRPEELPTPQSEADRIEQMDKAELNQVLARWLRPDTAHVICHTEGGWWQRRVLSRAIANGLT